MAKPQATKPHQNIQGFSITPFQSDHLLPMAGEYKAIYETVRKGRNSTGQPAEGRLFNPLNISIFDKIGQPDRFRRPVQVSPERIGMELSALRRLLLDNRIQLMVSSPHISDDGSPLFHCFLYDDYHPDPFFANEQTALNRCIRLLLDPTLPCAPDIFHDTIILNQYGPQRKDRVMEHIAHFKRRYDDIVSLEITSCGTEIHDHTCEVTGAHATGFIKGNRCLLRAGRWTVKFGLNDYAEWKIKELRIEDVDL